MSKAAASEYLGTTLRREYRPFNNKSFYCTRLASKRRAPRNRRVPPMEWAAAITSKSSVLACSPIETRPTMLHSRAVEHSTISKILPLPKLSQTIRSFKKVTCITLITASSLERASSVPCRATAKSTDYHRKVVVFIIRAACNRHSQELGDNLR